MIETENYTRVKKLVDRGYWAGPLLYYKQWDGYGIFILNTYIT